MTGSIFFSPNSYLFPTKDTERDSQTHSSNGNTVDDTIEAMTPSTINVALLLLAALTSGSAAWQMVQQTSPRSTLVTSTQLSVLSEPDQQEHVVVPYIVARGDGSTGGGGLPMPHEAGNSGNTGQARPKVGVEMPKGRPSWFRVPAPSHGVSCVPIER